jgi:hypothetical protein
MVPDYQEKSFGGMKEEAFQSQNYTKNTNTFAFKEKV